jgi:predicted glycoside hydrolase/deacetylase ChbG (UPF0249 family)
MPTAPEPMLKQLLVIADDYGMAAGVDQAVVELAGAGRLSGTSVLALGEHWAQGARWLRDLPQLQVGLHVDLPAGHDQLSAALLRAWARGFGRAGLTAHVDRQLDVFEQHHGRRPDYLDGHRHVHQWPVLRDVILACWMRRYTSPPAWARITRPAPGLTTFQRKAGIIHRLGGPAWEHRLQQHGIRHNHDFLGVYDFTGGPDRYAELLQGWLACAGPASLLMCHPASLAVPDDPIAAARLAEYQIWRSPELGDWLQAAHCHIVQSS